MSNVELGNTQGPTLTAIFLTESIGLPMSIKSATTYSRERLRLRVGGQQGATLLDMISSFFFVVCEAPPF